MLKRKPTSVHITPIDEEVCMADDEFIVSKTDLRGNITYANRTFMAMALLSEEQLLNINHNIVRHPDMPKGVFKFVWMTIKKEKEFFGFVKKEFYHRLDNNYQLLSSLISIQADTLNVSNKLLNPSSPEIDLLVKTSFLKLGCFS